MKEMMANGFVPFSSLTNEQKEKKINNLRASKKKQNKKKVRLLEA